MWDTTVKGCMLKQQGEEKQATMTHAALCNSDRSATHVCAGDKQEIGQASCNQYQPSFFLAPIPTNRNINSNHKSGMSGALI